MYKIFRAFRLPLGMKPQGYKLAVLYILELEWDSSNVHCLFRKSLTCVLVEKEFGQQIKSTSKWN